MTDASRWLDCCATERAENVAGIYMSGFMLARLARLLKENYVQLPFTLYLINAVQEEVGTKGAAMIAETLKPDCVFMVDVTHDTQSPIMYKQKEGDIGLGRGPVIMKVAPIHNNLRELLTRTAADNEIKCSVCFSNKRNRYG